MQVLITLVQCIGKLNLILSWTFFHLTIIKRPGGSSSPWGGEGGFSLCPVGVAQCWRAGGDVPMGQQCQDKLWLAVTAVPPAEPTPESCRKKQ